MNSPTTGCLMAAVTALLLFAGMVWLGERMVDAVLAIQWPI